MITKKEKKGLTISAKSLLRMIVGVSLLTLFVSMSVVFVIRWTDTQRQVFEQALKEARSVAQNVDRFNQLFLFESARFAQDGAIKGGILGRCPDLGTILNQKPGISNIIIYGTDGLPKCTAKTVKAAVPGGENIFNTKQFQQILKSAVATVGEVELDVATGQLYYPIGAPVPDENGNTFGVLVYHVDVQAQRDNVYSNQEDPGIQKIVINFAGGAIISTEELLVQRQIASNLKMRLDAERASGNELRLEMPSGDFAGLVRLKTAPWYSAVLIPQSLAYSGLVQSLMIQSAALALAALIGVVIATRIAGRISSATSHLVAVATSEGVKAKNTGISEIDQSLQKILQTRKAKVEAQKAIKQWQQTAERSSAGLALLRSEKGKTRIERANSAFFKLAGLSESIYNIGLEDLPIHSALKDPAAFRELQHALKSGGYVEKVAKGQDAFGNDIHIALDLAPLEDELVGVGGLPKKAEITSQMAEQKLKNTADQKEPKAGFYALTLDDLTTLIEREEQIAQHSTTDSLTGLPNRTLYSDRLMQAIEFCSRQHTQFACAFLNIDRFKQINDTLGHEAGDLFLVTLAKRLKMKMRQGDTLSRLGADEFGLIINETGNGKNELAFAIEHIKEVFSEPFRWRDQKVVLTGSIGVCMYPNDGQDPSTLLQRTDIALFQSKQLGGGKITYFDHDMRERFEERAVLEQDMKTALKQQEFEMFYQPKIDLITLRPIGMEALIRWNNSKGFISPAKFIPLAEEAGLIGELGRFALRQSVSDTQILMGMGFEVPVAVNISAKQLEVGFIEEIQDALDATNVPAKMLHAEITESLILPNSVEALNFFRQLEKMGIVISLDDFGTGWSNLATLKQLPLSALKMDRSFVDGLGRDNDDEALAQAVISMAKALGLYVIAEGVETREQANLLYKMGAHQAQGYLFAKPMNLQTLISWLERHYHGVLLDDGTKYRHSVTLTAERTVFDKAAQQLEGVIQKNVGSAEQ